MASQLSSILDIVASLQESARCGDWNNVRRLAAILSQQTLPTVPEELGEYLRCLQQALITAKVSRAHSAASLARINAAAGRLNAAAQFNNIRQEFGEVADS
jgi:hypothetical protein